MVQPSLANYFHERQLAGDDFEANGQQIHSVKFFCPNLSVQPEVSNCLIGNCKAAVDVIATFAAKLFVST